MHKLIISLICCLLPVAAFAGTPEIRENAPDRHVVVKGDTLWDIAAEFFKDPWKWPEIWGLNKETIKDPHWIYPGDVIILDRATGTLRIGDGTVTEKAASDAPADMPVVKLSPRARDMDSEHGAIPSIPFSDAAPFLTQPVILDAKGFEDAPAIAATRDGRVILGTGDVAFVKGLNEGKGPVWQVYRAGGKMLVDPDTHEVLGQEAPYLGDVTVEKLADVSTVKVTRALEEIKAGDRLYQAAPSTNIRYLPRAPQTDIAARIISFYGGVSRGGKNSIVTLNKGRRDGVESGHVLALYSKGEKISKNLTLPDERYGLLFVFRTFSKLSYALVVQANQQVELLDRAKTP